MTSATRALQAAGQGQFEIEALLAALSSQYTVVAGPKEFVRCVRLDTFDGRLGAAGLTLEHQIVAMEERLVLGRLDGSSTVVVPVKDLRWPALADVLPYGPVRDLIAPVSGVRALMVASDENRRIQRLALQNGQGKTVARVELDEPVSAEAAPAQLKVHSLRGYDEQARRADLLVEGLGLPIMEQGEKRDAVAAAPVFSPHREAPARVHLAAVLSDFLAAMRNNLPGLLEDVDSEFLHDFRVAVRRTRSTLKLGRPSLPDAMRLRWEPEFKLLGDMTTPLRDLDVYELDLPQMAGWLLSAAPADLEPLAAHLRHRRTAERHTLEGLLRSASFERLVADWEDELVHLADAPDDADQEQLSTGQLADRSISRAYQRVARDGAAISGDSPAEDLHKLRKRCKELRYALEVFAPVVAEGPRKRAVADLKGLQDVLGRFQDAEVQRHALRGFAEEMMTVGTTAGAMLAMGELIGHLEAAQDRARPEFDIAFARFARPSSLQLMHRLGDAEEAR
ncbi:MAG: CHAD domain-containing protein [Actinomycetota bacterium]